MYPTDFPDFQLTSNALLYRIHDWKHHTVHYASGNGRFDLPEPEGTCYFAEAPLGALLETHRESSEFTEGTLERRTLATYKIRLVAARLVDLTSDAAPDGNGWLSVSAPDRYDETRSFARAARSSGYDGIRYWSRYSDEADRPVRSIALFGNAGTWGGLPESLEQIPAAVIDQAAHAGVVVSFEPPRPKLIAVHPSREAVAVEGMCVSHHEFFIGLLSPEAIVHPNRWTVGRCPECDEHWKMVRYVTDNRDPAGDWMEIPVDPQAGGALHD